MVKMIDEWIERVKKFIRSGEPVSHEIYTLILEMMEIRERYLLK